MRPLRLLFAIKGMDLAKGGAERVLAQVTSELVERGHDVALVTFDAPGGQSFYRLHPQLRRISLGIGRVDRSATLAATARRIPALRREVRAERPDVVVGFMHSMFVPLAMALPGTGVPLVASEHNVPELYAGKPLEYALLTLAALRSARMTALSTAVMQLFPRMLHRRIVVMPNPVCDAGGRRADPAGPAEGAKILVSIGRLTAQKDHETLIRAYAMIAAEFPDWRLRIVGEGELRPTLEQSVKALALEDRVTFVGAVKTVDREYLDAQLFVIASRFEGFGLVTGEAMSFGLPVVGFADCPGTNELIEDGVNGVLVAPGERASNLAAALRSLMASGEKRSALGANGPKTVRQFGLEMIVDRWEQLLEDIANRPRTAPEHA